jgi:hypothetical protein
LGFIPILKGAKGCIKLVHPDLILEFLVPERGKGIEGPYPLPKLGINATTLRFLSFLSENTVKVKIEELSLTLPHPANFGLHKLIVSERRDKEDKAMKDRKIALEVLKTLVAKGRKDEIFNVFQSAPRGWQEKIVKCLRESGEKEIVDY